MVDAHLLTVVVLLQHCLQSGCVDAEISGRAQFHVLHQVYLHNNNTQTPVSHCYNNAVLWLVLELGLLLRSAHTALYLLLCPPFQILICLVTSSYTHQFNVRQSPIPNHSLTYLWFLGEGDEVFLILFYTVDQVGNGLENGRTVHVVLVRPRLNISWSGHFFVTVNKMCVTETPYRRCSSGLPPPLSSYHLHLLQPAQHCRKTHVNGHNNMKGYLN